MQQSVSVFAQTMNHYICPVRKYTANSIEFIRQTAFIGSLFLIRMSWAPMKIGQSQDRSEIISVEKSFVFFILFVKKIEMVLISDILYTTERLKKLNYFVCLPSWHTHTQNKEFKMHFNPNYWINWIKSTPKKEIRTVNKKKLGSHRIPSIEWSKCFMCLISVSAFFFSPSLGKCRVFVKWISLDCMLCSNIKNIMERRKKTTLEIQKECSGWKKRTILLL